MEYRIEIETHADQKIIHTTIAGVMSEKERDRVGVETIRKLRDNNISKVIWDLREAELDYSLIQSHMVVLNLPALGVKKEDYVAVIYFHNQEQHEHAQTVALNRSIFNLKYFQSFEDGLAWLIART